MSDMRPVFEAPQVTNVYSAYESLMAACLYYVRNGRQQEARQCYFFAMQMKWQIIALEMQRAYEGVGR